MSHNNYYRLLENGGFTDPGTTFETEVESIKTQYNAIPLDQAAAKKPLQVGSAPNDIPGSVK
jgi:hypothetical protein